MDIGHDNRTLTASAQRHGLRSPSSESRALTTDLPSHLVPATTDDFRRELTACLVLVAPAGMTEDSRNEWLRVAWGTLRGIPVELLRVGAGVARRTCDHPSKIVPTIMREVGTDWNSRRREAQERVGADRRLEAPKPEYVTAAQAASILAEHGIKLNETIADKPTNRARSEPPTIHDIADVAKAMGIAPVTSDTLPPAPSIEGLSVAEIFAQRDRRRAESLAA